jgi:tetratricopeptide (TPR) repeat protein
MDRPDIELHVRREADLPTLQALQQALEGAGESPTLTAVPGLTRDGSDPIPSGPLPCRVRVLVGCGSEPPAASAEKLVVIEDRMLPPALLHPSGGSSGVLASADLILVPGPAHVRHLERHVAAVVATGIPRLGPIWRDLEGERGRARLALGIPEAARLALYAPAATPGGSAIDVIGNEIARIAAAGWIGLILPQDWPAEWVARHRTLVAQVPGLALVAAADGMLALAAADAIISDVGSLLYEGLVLGKGVVRVACEAPQDEDFADLGPRIQDARELEAALESVLPGTPAAQRFDAIRQKCRRELLSYEGDAPARAAREIQRHFCSRETDPAPSEPSRISDGVSGAAPNDRDTLDMIEAHVSFGDTEGALRMLKGHLDRYPSTRAHCLRASIHRRRGDIEAARDAARSAERLAREELGRALCEHGRVHVDAGDLEAGQAAFEEAREVAPAIVDCWVGLGSLALHRQDPVAAERCFRQALDIEKSSRVLSGLGLALVGQQRGREALSCLEAALDLDAESVSAIYGLVQAAFQSGEIAVAERRVRAYVDLHSGNLDLLFTLAGLRCQLGDRPGACEMIERIELFQPDYPGLEELRQKLGT